MEEDIFGIQQAHVDEKENIRKKEILYEILSNKENVAVETINEEIKQKLIARLKERIKFATNHNK